MKENQAARMLFKKLSALRATLSNEEQHLLDSLLMEGHQLPNKEPNNPEAVGHTSSLPEAPSAEPGPHTPDSSGRSIPLRITFDQELEIYIVE